MELVKKIEDVLRRTFPEPGHMRLEDNDGITGWVASACFRGLDFRDRANLIWDVLDKELSNDERRRIVTIVAVTPEEEIAHRARRAPAEPKGKRTRKGTAKSG